MKINAMVLLILGGALPFLVVRNAQGEEGKAVVNYDVIHTVQRGDSWWGLAQRYRVQLRYLLKRNPKLSEGEGRLTAGQKITIPNARTEGLATEAGLEAYTWPPGGRDTTLCHYDVVGERYKNGEPMKSKIYATERWRLLGREYDNIRRLNPTTLIARHMGTDGRRKVYMLTVIGRDGDKWRVLKRYVKKGGIPAIPKKLNRERK